ncbi:hypothetical protein EYF80_010833 [Liparis tanakae]|uniref:Uncharacterized protein n=1 Tax=Liparis tanakae TaxID=230148 RepID=A0A4Z2IMB4_9TELE|nr:hypothetical protein EYF80_010833 [Liparis tanakae]
MSKINHEAATTQGNQRENNLLTHIDSFIIQGVPCVAFEMSDRRFWELLVQRQAPPTPNESWQICTITNHRFQKKT